MSLSPAQMQQAIIHNLKQKTGKTLSEWIALARSLQAASYKELQQRLKAEFGLGHVQAQTVVWHLQGQAPYIETQGYEAGIFKVRRELYEALKSVIAGMSAEVQVKPCKTYVAFYRSRQFAIVTEKKGVLVLGLNLPDAHYAGLQVAGSLGGSQRINRMCTLEQSDFTAVAPYIQRAFNNN